MTDERSAEVFDNAPFAVMILGPDGLARAVNPAWERLWHAAGADVVGHYNALTDPQVAGTTLGDLIQRGMKGEAILGMTTFYDPSKSGNPGESRWFRLTVYPTKDSSGHVDTLIIINEDIDKQKSIEDALTKNTEQLREAEKLAHLGYWRWDIKTGEVEWSPEVFTIFRLDPKIFKPQIDSILALSPWPEDNKRDKELIERAMKSHEPRTYEQRFLYPDGSSGYYQSTFRGNYDEQGELVSIVGTVIDITELKKGREAQLHTAELEQFNKLLVDRELKMIELKKELERLKAELARKS